MKASSSIARLCRLCHEPKPLCRSHIIPEFMYAGLYDSNHQMAAYIEEYGRMRHRVPQIGHREHLLCVDCEDRINRNFEDPNIGFWRALVANQPPPPGVSIVPVAGARASLVSGFDYPSVKLLFLSIFWRASVASRWNYLVNLGEHEETIRRMILERRPGASTAYPCLVYRVTGSAGATKILRRPVGTEKDGWASYQLLLPGAVLWFVVSGNAPAYSLAPKEDGSMHVAELHAKDVPIIQETIATLHAVNR